MYQQLESVIILDDWPTRDPDDSATLYVKHLEISDYKRRREYNRSFSPLVRLAPELVVEIVQNLRSKSEDCEWWSRLPLWIQITHVCHDIREILVNYRHLWNKIDCSHDTLFWVEQKMKRSEGIPLVVHSCDPDFVESSLQDKVLTSVLKKLDMIQELVVSAFPSEWMSCLMYPAPLLERCYLGFYDMRGRNTVETKLFDGKAPQLKHLSLLGCELNWRPLLTVNLVSLEIAEVFLGQESFLSTKEILEALSHSLHLRRLTLNCVLVPDEESLDSLTVNLPELKYLKILSSLRGCVQLLSRLAFRLVPRIKIDCYPTEVTDPEAQLHDIQLLASIIQKTSAEHPIRSLRIRKVDNEEDLRIHAWTSSKPQQKERFAIKAPSFHDEESRARAAILQTLFTKGYSYLQFLDISYHNFTLTDAEWKRIGELDSLEEIQITSIHAAGFAKVFSVQDGGAQLVKQKDAVKDLSFKVLRILQYSRPPLFQGDSIISADAFRDMLFTSLKARELLKLNIPTLRYLSGGRYVDM